MKPKISVVQVTNRYGGFDVIYNTLKRQTFKDWELIYYDTICDKRRDAVQAYCKGDPRVKHYQQPPKDPKAKTWLAHAENGAIKHATGDLVVFLQDFIYIQADALEKYWLQYQTNPKFLVTGVGHQYGSPGKADIADLNGLTTLFSTPFRGLPIGVVWQDPRMRTDLGSFYPCQPADIEFNFCAVPRQALLDVGGCDEEYDYIGFAFDNCSVAERAFILGYQPYIDQSNESFSINSDAWSKSSAKTDDNFIAIATFHQNRINDIKHGKYPVKLPYLDDIPTKNI
mgnify:CR=1 FL=1